jgi:anti-sigma-K factor RskA
MLTPMRVRVIAIGCAGLVLTGGLVAAQTGAARNRGSDTYGFKSEKLSSTRCRVEGFETFLTAEPFRYRARVSVQYRKRGSRTWHGLARGTTRGRGPGTEAPLRVRERVPLVVKLRPSVMKLIADGARFRAQTEQKLKVGTGSLERSVLLQGLRLKQCDLVSPSRVVETSLTTGLKSVDSGSGKGTTSITRKGKHRRVISVTARVPRSKPGEAYQVWLYNSRGDARSLGSKVVGSSGKLRSSRVLPSGYRHFQFVDVSREKAGGGSAHSGRSVLRGPVPD